jgi:glutamine---fructose-6-phosphate transaminase (isomerizing)
MNSIESLKLDFNSQIKQLYNIHNRKLFDDCIYVGSGDSYVAGLIVEYLTSHKCRCHSPSDLFNSRFVKDKTYCFISVTGRTKANIEVAKLASQAGVKTVAVTLNKKSDLAQICDEIVLPDIKRTYTPTAGFGTFVGNVVTCLQIAGLTIPQKFDIWHENGVQLSHSWLKSFTIPQQTLYLLGNNTLYALALYASLQMAEFFGSTAFAHKLEEFCHSPIFGLPKSHRVWILGQNDDQIIRRLRRLGLRLSYIELYNKDVFTQLFVAIFFVQSLILLLAERYRYTELQYLTMKDVLEASSDIIYGQID